MTPTPPPRSSAAGSIREPTHEHLDDPTTPRRAVAEPIPPIRKAAILVVSLEQPLASKLLAQLDRSAVEAVTLEIARLDRIDPIEQRRVLDEFFDLGLRRLWFAFDDVVKLADRDLRAAYHDDDAPALGPRPGRRRPPGARPRPLRPSGRLRRGPARPSWTASGPFRLDDAEGAQSELVEHLRRLHDRGLLTLPEPTGREAVFV